MTRSSLEEGRVSVANQRDGMPDDRWQSRGSSLRGDEEAPFDSSDGRCWVCAVRSILKRKQAETKMDGKLKAKMERLTPLKRFLSTPCKRELNLSINKDKTDVTVSCSNFSNDQSGIFNGEASSYHSVKVVEGKGVKRGSNLNSSASSSNLNLVKGQWSKEEDSMLVSLVRQHGVRKWSEIAKELVGRIGKQCRERWHNHLRPDIKKESWTEEEERLLIEAHEKLGNKWAEIAKRIPGRSENSIKNHWNASKRKQNSTRKNKGKSKNGSGSNPSILQEYIKTLSTSPVKTPSIQQSSSHLQFPTTDYPCNPSNAITLMNNQNPNTTFQEGAYYNIQAEIEEPSMDVGGSLDYLNCLESPQQPQLLHGESYADCSDNKDGSYKHTHWDSRICYLLNGGPSPSFEAHQEMDKDSVLEEKDYDSSFLSNRDMDLIEMISSRSSNSNSKRSSSGSCYI